MPLSKHSKIVEFLDVAVGIGQVSLVRHGSEVPIAPTRMMVIVDDGMSGDAGGRCFSDPATTAAAGSCWLRRTEIRVAHRIHFGFNFFAAAGE